MKDSKNFKNENIEDIIEKIVWKKKRKFRRLVISCFLNFSHFHTLF